MTTHPARRIALLAAIAFGVTTIALVPARGQLDKAHIALVLLLVVLGASALGGRLVGVGAAVTGFLIFNFFFLPPYHTFIIADPLDWVVLVAFLATGMVAAQLLHRSQREADSARRQAAEVERLLREAQRAETLREAVRVKDALLATVSHDLRTPLTTIRALAHDIGAAGDERGVVIAEEAERMNRFIADLLDLSRLKGGALTVNAEINAAEDLMGAALQRVGGLSRGRDLRASLDPADPVLAGRFDFAGSLRILGNLLENALKYSPEDSPVEFTVRREGEQLRFDVLDRGPGIPDDLRDRLFEPFVRTSDTRDGRGTGLGLAIAHGLAIAQGGSLTYAPREGGGSVFSLRLPAAEVATI